MVTKFIHHKKPRHMGGTDDESNLVEVTAEQHANLHLDLYLTYGKYEDWIAFQAIAGLIGKEELHRAKARLGAFAPQVRTKEANDKRSHTMMGKNKGKVRTQKQKERISQKTREAMDKLGNDKLNEMRLNGKRRGELNKKCYEILTPSGDILTIKGLVEFCSNNNLHASNLIKASQNNKLYKGYRCRVINNLKQG